MKNYIVRIYRQEKDNPRRLVGIVEEPEKEEKRAFTNLDELWKILESSKDIGHISGKATKEEGLNRGRGREKKRVKYQKLSEDG